MPIYPYKCDHCGAEIEITHRIVDKPRRICPVCKKRKLKRQIGKTTFHLVGDGWASSGYK